MLFHFWIVIVSLKLAKLTCFEVNAKILNLGGGAVDYYTLSTARYLVISLLVILAQI